jgi:hypothetical protein
MNFGFDADNGNKFYVEHTSCSRPSGTLRQESDRRARDMYLDNPKLMLCLSSGLDSQIALHSFKSQGIPVECSFLRLGGFNDNEYTNLKVLEKKYGFTANVVELDPNACREELEHLSGKLDAHLNHCIQHKFVSQLPKDYDVIQVLHDPWLVTRKDNAQHYIYQSYYDPEIARYRALTAVEGRTGKIQMFGNSSEYFLSSINDELFHYFLKSWVYYDGNGFMLHDLKVNDVLRYEYYIKPMLYAKHWGDDLIYFPKFSGYENIDWLYKSVRRIQKEKQCFIPWKDLITHYQACNGTTKRYYEINIPG